MEVAFILKKSFEQNILLLLKDLNFFNTFIIKQTDGVFSLWIKIVFFTQKTEYVIILSQ